MILRTTVSLSRRALLHAGLLILPASSASADLYDDYVNSVSKQPFVSFFARDDTTTGHTFIAVGTELDNGLTVYEGIFGYYPADGAKKIFKFRGTGRGVIKFGENDYPSSIRYRKNVSEAQKSSVLRIFDRWNTNDPKYNLLARGGMNCNSLAKEVAQELGLRIPTQDPGMTLPANYIRALRDTNTNP